MTDPSPCRTCGHPAAHHSDLVGCLSDKECDCDAYVSSGEAPAWAGGPVRAEVGSAAAYQADSPLMPLWRVKAQAVLLELIQARQPFSADDITSKAGEPPRPNAMGGLFHAARAQGLIQPVAFVLSERPKAHARVIRVWVAA